MKRKHVRRGLFAVVWVWFVVSLFVFVRGKHTVIEVAELQCQLDSNRRELPRSERCPSLVPSLFSETESVALTRFYRADFLVVTPNTVHVRIRHGPTS
jgi:hypothetical protein